MCGDLSVHYGFDCVHLVSGFLSLRHRIWVIHRTCNRRMFSSPHKFHLVAVRKRPAMLESEISKFYPSSRRSCKYNLLDFTYADFHKAFFASHNTNQISLDKIIFLIHRLKRLCCWGLWHTVSSLENVKFFYYFTSG